jgi:hypothetical protein
MKTLVSLNRTHGVYRTRRRVDGLYITGRDSSSGMIFVTIKTVLGIISPSENG